jgi:hypothetical protein
MGCGGSTSEAKASNRNPKLDSKPLSNDFDDDKDDEEVQVLQPAKAVPKNKLDEVTVNTSVLSKTQDKTMNESGFKEMPRVENGLRGKNQTLLEPSIEEVKEESRKDEKIHKAKTVKVEFESHPHEFDFSFIDEQPKHKHESDILTDQVLKEISELN